MLSSIKTDCLFFTANSKSEDLLNNCKYDYHCDTYYHTVGTHKVLNGVTFFQELRVRSNASCASHCPMHLMPMFIERAVDAEDAAEAKKLHALSCLECGCCSYVCPACRPLVTSMRRAKKLIKEKGV